MNVEAWATGNPPTQCKSTELIRTLAIQDKQDLGPESSCMNDSPAGRVISGEPRVLAIVPAYNEAGSLPTLIAVLKSRYPQYDVAAINDGSTDDTAEAVRRSGVRLVSLPCNLGIGGAVQTGFRIARDEGYDVAVQVDGDGQHPADQVHLVVSSLLETGADIAIGSRFLGGDGSQPSVTPASRTPHRGSAPSTVAPSNCSRTSMRRIIRRLRLCWWPIGLGCGFPKFRC